MKRIVSLLLIGLLIVLGIVYLATTTDQRVEANAMTGAIRSQIRYAYIFNTPWKVRSTWIDDSAARQGISTEKGWQCLSVVSKTIFTTGHACSRSPVSYKVSFIDPDDLNLHTTVDIDNFAREFITGDKVKRAQLISIR